MACELVPLAWEHAEALRRIHQEPEVARWWGAMEPTFPFDEPTSPRFAILVDGEVAGMVQYWEETEEEFRHAGIDLFVATAHQGRGVGTEAVRRVLGMLHAERGHHRVVIDPAVDNRAAVRAYEKAGFAPVGVLRRAWRDPDGVWRDCLLMEHVTSP